MDLAIYCADIGSIRQGNFGWARSYRNGSIDRSGNGNEIAGLVDSVDTDLREGRQVALGFECPLYVPVPLQPLRLGAGRDGEGTHPWSAGAGAAALATGVVEAAWVLAELRSRNPDAVAYLDWTAFAVGGRGLFLWEAFVTGSAKTGTHVGDATAGVSAFHAALPDPWACNEVWGERPFSLVGGAMLWSGWSEETALLRTPCLVIKALPERAP